MDSAAVPLRLRVFAEGGAYAGRLVVGDHVLVMMCSCWCGVLSFRHVRTHRVHGYCMDGLERMTPCCGLAITYTHGMCVQILDRLDWNGWDCVVFEGRN